MRRLICIFVVRIWHNQVLSWRGSNRDYKLHVPFQVFLFYYHTALKVPTSANEPHDKTNKMSVRPAKTQTSLGIHPVWSESLLCTKWVAKDPRFLHVDSEDIDQTGWMPRLIWVFAGRTVTLLVLSCCGSYLLRKVTSITTYLRIVSLCLLKNFLISVLDIALYCSKLWWPVGQCCQMITVKKKKHNLLA